MWWNENNNLKKYLEHVKELIEIKLHINVFEFFGQLISMNINRYKKKLKLNTFLLSAKKQIK